MRFIILKLARWILRHDRNDYLRGWHDGVEQYMYDPKSCYPINGREWLTYEQYWGDEE